MKTMIHKSRILQFGAMLLAALVVIASAAAAQEPTPKAHDGTFVSFAGDKLVMTSPDGKEHSHTLMADAKVTLDGKVTKAADLKKGTKIRVTTQGTDLSVVSQIEAIDKNLAFASNQHDGKFVSIADNKLVMTSEDGKEHSHKLMADAKVTLDGKTYKVADLKKGTRIRVTTLQSDMSIARRIEAIDQNPQFASNLFEGKIVSISGNTLVMTNHQGKDEHTCMLNPTAKVTCDGKACKSSDLKPGMKVLVTSDTEDFQSAVCVEAIDKNLEFASVQHDGKVVSIIGNKLIMTSTSSKEEQTCTLMDSVKVTCDGKVCKSSDLKPGMKIRVTTESNNPHSAIRIEAIEKNLEFASL